MTDKDYLDKALALIVELTEDDPSFMCEKLHEIEGECQFCANNCENFDRFCLMRYLQYYKPNQTKKQVFAK